MALSDPNHEISNDGSDNDNDDGDFRGPRPTVEEVLACQFSSWYPTFSKILPLEAHVDNENQVTLRTKRKNVTIPSVIIEDLPVPEFKNYLLSDGVTLPKEATKLSSCAGVSNIDEDDEDETGDGDGDGDHSDAFCFPGLTQRIQETIQDRFPSAGGILPKLNWSAPRDATWMNEGTMKCKTPGDVYLLLKSSDFCTHDVLYESLKDCRDYATGIDASDSGKYHPPLQLVLRKWCNLNPSMEFRCFVRNHELLGISQRQHSVHYPHLNEDKDKLYELVHDFFEDYVRHRFAGGTVRNYVWDVFVDKKDRAWIVDFNPWGRTTDSLLYEWSELVSTDLDDARDYDAENGMRIATSEREVRHDPLASYRAPIDTVDLASMTHGDAKQFEEFMKLCQRPTYWEENSEDDDTDS